MRRLMNDEGDGAAGFGGPAAPGPTTARAWRSNRTDRATTVTIETVRSVGAMGTDRKLLARGARSYGAPPSRGASSPAKPIGCLGGPTPLSL